MIREYLVPHKGVWEVFGNNGHEAYFVGGCVRDALIGRKAKDIDIATDAKPEAVKKMFPGNFDTGLKYGSITVEYDGHYYDVTTYRSESGYSDMRRPDRLEFSREIEPDLHRRDFTVNAMAYNFDKGHIDLFGGVTDLNKKIIRAVGKPSVRFREDALRMMRAVRFACELDFTIEPKTLGAIRRNRNGIKYISKERIYAELKRAVVSKAPERLEYLRTTSLGHAIHPGFRHLAYTGMPASADLILRLAHMLRRRETALEVLGFLKAEKSTLANVLAVIRGMNESRTDSKYEVRKLISTAGEANAKRVIMLKGTGLDLYNEILRDEDCTSLKDLAINGSVLITRGIATEGLEVRQILNVLLDEVMKDPSKNNFDKLIALSYDARKRI
ncbi:MAG: hypothetical protein JXB33_08225 [Clostridia bacterium]|nr:hypothetical protein [Clostridia bacterium]